LIALRAKAMRNREFIPSESLRPYVRLFWVLELDDPIAFGPPERIAPDGLLEVVFHYRTPLAFRYAGEEFAPQPRSVAVSQTRRFVEIRPEGAIGLISVRFQPWGAYHFFRPAVSAIADHQIATEFLWGQDAVDLEERLAAAAGDGERIALVESFLEAQLRRHHKADVEPLVRAVWKRKGRGTTADLCSDLGVGERWLQRRFAAAMGTTPKGFSRLCRFLHACSLLRSGPASRLGDVGLECGYYDQSHFIAEFRAFSGMTPRAFSDRTDVAFLETG
jgi:AraC-like DNA-binding protein